MRLSYPRAGWEGDNLINLAFLSSIARECQGRGKMATKGHKEHKAAEPQPKVSDANSTEDEDENDDEDESLRELRKLSWSVVQRTQSSGAATQTRITPQRREVRRENEQATRWRNLAQNARS